MEQIEKRLQDIKETQQTEERESVLREIHPLAKLSVTMLYIVVTASFQKYDCSGLFVMVLYPVLLFQLGDLSIRDCISKVWFVLPLVCAVGLLNPLFDHTPLAEIGGVVLTGGMVSFLTLMLKGVFCVIASFLLVATTPIDEICAALRILHVPNMLVSLILLTYRYITVLMEELSVMTLSYKLRAPGQNGIAVSAWGSFLGQLLLRSMDRAQEIYTSMELRGFDGEFRYAAVRKIQRRDVAFMLLAVGCILTARFVNVAVVLGNFVTMI